VATQAPPRAGRLEEFRRRKDLLLALTRSDLLARYGRGPMQLIKWLLDPFALVGAAESNPAT
jgi:hypothetical protein